MEPTKLPHQLPAPYLRHGSKLLFPHGGRQSGRCSSMAGGGGTQPDLTYPTWQKCIPLYPGIELCYLTLSSDPLSVRHKAMPYMIQINYCKAGQMVWEMRIQINTVPVFHFPYHLPGFTIINLNHIRHGFSGFSAIGKNVFSTFLPCWICQVRLWIKRNDFIYICRVKPFYIFSYFQHFLIHRTDLTIQGR